MRNLLSYFLWLALMLVSVTATGTANFQSIDGEYSLDSLLAQAEANFNLDREDAVILLDARYVKLRPDGRLEQRVHRVIWIGESSGESVYGDHRIPYDSEHTDMFIETVRTWRDGRWWVTGPTGSVETLPRSLVDAYDYSGLREMMLLHDGLELPCVLEIDYSIVDKESFREGLDELWLFAKRDPVIVSLIEISVPVGTKLATSVSSEVEPDIRKEGDLEIRRWQMELLSALPYPAHPDPAAFKPHLLVSTWTGWNDLGDRLSRVFSSSSTLTEEISAQLDSLLEDSRSDFESAKLIAKFVSDKTRFVGYRDELLWNLPRQAHRVYETAYAGNLDRAILTYALLKQASLTVSPAVISLSPGELDNDVPSLARFGTVGLWLVGEGWTAIYDPSASSMKFGTADLIGHNLWVIERDKQPVGVKNQEKPEAEIELIINLECKASDSTFVGKGILRASGSLCPYGAMLGLDHEGKRYVGNLVGSVFEGAKVTDYSLVKLEESKVIVGFAVTLPLPDKDDFGRIPLRIGNLSGGVMAKLPRDVHLYTQMREGPVLLPEPLVERVVLRLKVDSLNVVYLPADVSRQNDAGSFELTTEQKSSELSFDRLIRLNRSVYDPGSWTDMRQLLLDCSSRHNGLILLSTKTDKDEKNK